MNAEMASTPLMRQYHAIKQQVPGALLMFRLGDFYELFFDDAVLAARELEITLTARNKEKGTAIPMCGVPFHSAEGYIARLIGRGYRVAICDQMEEAGSRQETRPPRSYADRDTRHRDRRASSPLPRKQLPRRRCRATAFVPASPMSMSRPENSAPPNSISSSSPACSKASARAKSLVAAEAPLIPAARTETLDRHRAR